MSALTLRATVEPMGPAGAFVLSDEQVAELGGGKRAAVVVRVGHRSARLRLAVMGGCNLIGLSKANRQLLGVEIGDEVTVEIALDEAPREVVMPDDLATALAAQPGLASTFEDLAFTHRKEFVAWINEAKTAGTRERRVTGTLEMLAEGRTRS